MNPNERLRILLRLERQHGVTFDDAWKRSTVRVAAQQANPDAWYEVFEWSRDAWQRAYEDRPRLCIDWLESPVQSDGHALPAPRMRLIA